MNVAGIIEKARREGRRALLETEAKEICQEYGIPVPEFAIAHDSEAVVRIAKKLGYPLVLKVVSPEIVHKSEVGGVLTNVKNARDASKGYASIVLKVKASKPQVHIEGILVQKMAPPSLELIVGAYRDITFGPVIMFGVGGVLVEVYKDVVSTLAPVSVPESKDMIRRIKGHRLLEGYRGSPRLDEQSISLVISICSRLMLEQPAISELDINPLLAYENGVSAVDARIILSGS